MSHRTFSFRFRQAAVGLAASCLCFCGGSSSGPTIVQIPPNANLLIISTSTTGHLPDALANAPYSYGFETNLGFSGVNAVPPVKFLPNTQLPPGMTLSPAGVLSGTPSQVGTFTVFLEAVDSSPTPRTAEASYLLTVRSPGATLTQVAHTDLGGHGQNADVTVATASATNVPYAYVGTRGSPGDCPATGVKIVDISKIDSPQLVAVAGGVSGASQQEARILTGISTTGFHAGGKGDLMAVTEQPCDPSDIGTGQTGVRFYDVSDPTAPSLLGTWNSGVAGASDVAFVPAGSRLFALVAVPNSETQSTSPEGDLRVLDITDPAQPQEIGNWGILAATATPLPQAVQGQDQRVFLDSIRLSSDRHTAYLSYWDEGVAVLDVTDPTAIRSNNAAIFLNHITYPVTSVATTTTPSSPEGNTHLALPVVNDTELLVADKVCASATNSTEVPGVPVVPTNPAVNVVCGKNTAVPLDVNHGWGFLRTYDLPTPGSASIENFYATPEAESAPAPDDGIYTVNSIAWNGDANHPHAYLAWFSSGVIDLDLTSINPPTVLATFVPPATPDPNGSTPGVDNLDQALVYGVASFNQNSQPYILASDVNSGLWILQESPTSELTILTTSLPDGNVGVPYRAQVVAANGTLGPANVTFNVINSANPLPSGLSMDSNGNISGTPEAAGTVAVTFTAADSAGHSTQQTINITIAQKLAILPTLDSSGNPIAPPLATTQEAYTLQLNAVNGTAPLTWSLANSKLPAGLAIAASTGEISGTPTSPGTTQTTVQVTDSSSPPLTATAPVTIQVAGLQPTKPTLPAGSVGVEYADTVAMANGTGPYTPVVVHGSLPPGIAVSTGSIIHEGWLISGTPTQAGVFPFTVMVTDADGQTMSQPFTLVVNPYAVTPAVLPSGAESQGYLTTLSAQGGVAPYRFYLVTGALPQGLTLGLSGTLTGVPAAGTAGTYSVGIQAVDDNGLVTTATYTLVIFTGHTFAVTTTGLPPAQAGNKYSQVVTADFGTPAYQFSIANGSLPPGLSLTTNGILAGVPATDATGTYAFTLQATDGAGLVATQRLVLTVLSAVSPQ